MRRDEGLLAALVGQTFRERMFAREPGEHVVRATYIKRVIEIYGSPDEPDTHASYYFMVFRITLDDKETRDYAVETSRDGLITDEELKHAAQGFVMSYVRGTARTGEDP